MFIAQGHDRGKEGWNTITTEQDTQVWNVKIGQRNIWRHIFQRFYGQMKWEWLLMDQIDGIITWSWMVKGYYLESKWLRCTGLGCYYQGWASCTIEDGLKINSQTYCQVLEDTFFKQWYRKKSAASNKTIVFMQFNALSYVLQYSSAWLPSKGLKDDNNDTALFLWSLRFTNREDSIPL